MKKLTVKYLKSIVKQSLKVIELPDYNCDPFCSPLCNNKDCRVNKAMKYANKVKRILKCR